MLQSLQKLFVGLTYPPALSLCLIVIAVGLLILHRRAGAATIFVAAIAWSALWSVPMASDWLRARLEQRYPPVDEATLPRADAIVVLGGGMRYGWLDRPDVRAEDLENSRLAAGARAWLAGRAPVVILSGGGENGGDGSEGSEARMMATAITRLGVPASALLLEERSHNTRDNARFTATILRESQRTRCPAGHVIAAHAACDRTVPRRGHRRHRRARTRAGPARELEATLVSFAKCALAQWACVQGTGWFVDGSYTELNRRHVTF